MKRKCLCILLCLLLAFGQTLAIFAEQIQQPSTEPGQIQQTVAEQQTAEMEAEIELTKLPLYDRFIVKLKPDEIVAFSNETTVSAIDTSVQTALPAAKSAANAQVQAVLDEKQLNETALFDLATTPAYTVEEQSPELLTVSLTEKVDAATFTAELAENAQIEYIQPDYIMELSAEEDPLEVILTPAESEEVTIELEETVEPITEIEPNPDVAPEPLVTPSAAPVVAVIDSGIDVAHYGLTGHILPGYDFVNNTELTYNFSKKNEYMHGTHVAGIIAQNAPEAQILPLKVFEYGRAYTSDIIRAIEYAEEHSASVVNMSFGSTDDNRALKEAMQASDMLFVCAAGNHRLDVEETPIYPACFDLENIISVASLNQDLGFSYYSNYGTESVDIAAIGRNVYSMWPEGEYGEMSGTSQAAAQVSAGAAVALLRGGTDAKAAVLACAERLAHLDNKVADGRSLSMENIESGVQPIEVQTVEYEDDFDVHGYQPTPEENWELFSSTKTVDVATGLEHTLVLKENGTVWAWGNNSWGKLGVNDWEDRSTPVRVIGLKNICSISATSETSYAIDEDGQVYEWGLFYLDGPGHNLIPYQRGTVPGAVEIIGAGTSAASILCEDGSVYEWGFNKEANHNNEYFIRQRMDLHDIIAISGGYALAADGTIYERGMEEPIMQGVGIGESLYVHPLVTVGNIPGAVRFGANQTLITQVGDVWKIDYTRSEGTVTYNVTKIESLSNIKNVYGGNDSYFIKTKDNKTLVWGQNPGKILQAGLTNIEITMPQEVPALQHMTQFAISGSRVYAVHENSDIYVWGDNEDGLIGTGNNQQWYDTPTPIMEPFADWAEAQEITVPCEGQGRNSINWYTFVAPFTAEYTFFADGNMLQVYDAMLGTPDAALVIQNWGEMDKPTIPCTLIAGERYYIEVNSSIYYYSLTVRMASPVSIAAGNGHSLAIDENGGILASGRGNYGQLGNGVREHSTTLVQVKDSAGTAAFSNAVAVAAGFGFSLALKEDGTLWTWGNATGFMTNTGDSHSDLPVPVLDEDGQPLDDILSVSAKGTHWLALKKDGTVWSWGGNESGQLGDNTRNNSLVPVQVKGKNGSGYLTGVESIDAGSGYSMALLEDGTLMAWGHNYAYQLGDGTQQSKNAPVQVLNAEGTGTLANVVEFSSNNDVTMAKTVDGRIWIWGTNVYGQFGNGTSGNYSTLPRNYGFFFGDNTPPPVRTMGFEFEQSFNTEALIQPEILGIHAKVVDFEQGIYTLYLAEGDYICDENATPFFFWTAKEGVFEQVTDDFNTVLFYADSGTEGKKIKVVVGIGDGFGNVNKKVFVLDRSLGI